MKRIPHTVLFFLLALVVAFGCSKSPGDDKSKETPNAAEADKKSGEKDKKVNTDPAKVIPN